MLAASRHRVNAARAWAGDAPASPQAGVITACSAHVASGSPSRRHIRMTRSAVSRASAAAVSRAAARSLAGRSAATAGAGACGRLVRHRRDRAGQQAHARLGGLGHPVLVPPP